jgi:hypothetical protein
MRFWVGLLALVSLAPPVMAEDGGANAEIHPTVRTERTYFHCVGPAKVQNVAFAQGSVPGWNTTAPTQSVQAGAGCGYYENAGGAWLGPNRTTLDSEWEGTFTGNVDSITVELHNIHVSAARATGPFLARLNLLIDGVEVFNGPATGDLRMTPVPSATKLSEKMTFTLTRVGLLTEDGDGTRVRTFRLVMRSLSEEQSAWVWDTTEVPAGLTFNPIVPEAVQAPIH